ncbi:MAG: hypothetical protein IPM29_21545 [Planctomycetes bacterium]|nr:hypothetical protein [Planctomycetota bacterium]
MSGHVVILAVAALCGLAPAQQQDPFVHVPLRIVSVGANDGVVVDRGRRDLVEVGDLVLFTPRQGGTYRGSVIQVDRRTAVVRLAEPGFGPVAGIAGEVLVPRARRDAGNPADGPAAAPADPGAGEVAQRWRNRDDGWRPGMPLLDRERAVRPEERPRRVTGRAWLAGDLVSVSGDRSNSYLRIGTAFDVENVASRGGALHFDGEVNHRTENDGSGFGESEGLDAIIRRLSYSSGGDRFDRDGVEVGRFLQRGMPELGILDGAEWTGRADGGDRYGVAVGFLPEPDDDHESGQDLQLGAHYLWSLDPAERVVVGLGLQKTFHDGSSDRDLVVAKVRYLPEGPGWDLFATGWLDFYFGEDNAKDAFAELTQAYVTTGRSWSDGSRIDFAWRRQRFPEHDRQGEYLPVLRTQLADDRYDRLSFAYGSSTEWHARPHCELAVWSDEGDEGVAADLGLELRDVFTSGDRLDLVAFGNSGEIAWYAGGRVTYGVATRTGRWDVLYEYTFSRYDAFADDRDDLAQHRLRLSDSFRIGTAWDVSLHGGLVHWDGDTAWDVGTYIQWTF